MIKRVEMIRTRMTGGETVTIAVGTAMISTVAIRTAIGIGTKTTIAYISTEIAIVIVTMMRITTAIIARTAAEDLTAETASGVAACRRRIRADLTGYYWRWLGYRRSNNQSEAESMDRRMRDLYAHYGIPNNVPFNQVASPGAGPIVAY